MFSSDKKLVIMQLLVRVSLFLFPSKNIYFVFLFVINLRIFMMVGIGFCSILNGLCVFVCISTKQKLTRYTFYYKNVKPITSSACIFTH